jgi:DUF2917 family protein
VDAYKGVTAYAEMISIGIACGNVARIQNARGVLLRVQYGPVWITQSGSADDVCLDTGEWFHIDRDGRTLVSPAGYTPLALVTLAPSIRTTPSFAQRIATALRSLLAGLSRTQSRPSPA